MELPGRIETPRVWNIDSKMRTWFPASFPLKFSARSQARCFYY